MHAEVSKCIPPFQREMQIWCGLPVSFQTSVTVTVQFVCFLKLNTNKQSYMN